MKKISLFSAAGLLFLVSGPAFADIPGHDNPPISIETGDWLFTFGGFAQTSYIFSSFNDSSVPDEANPNNVHQTRYGFANLNARLSFGMNYNDFLTAKISIDSGGGFDTFNGGGSGDISLKDAYMDFDIVSGFRVKLGHIKPPVGFEQRTSETDSDFSYKSFISGGGSSSLVSQKSIGHRIEPSRELGLEMYSDILDYGSVGFRYSVAVTNGYTGLDFSNYDGAVFFYGRLELDLMKSLYDDVSEGHFMSFALNGSYGMAYDDTTENEHPDIGDASAASVSGEIRVNVKGFHLDFEAFWKKYMWGADGARPVFGYPEFEPKNELNVFATVVQASYLIPIEYCRFQIGYRFAMHHPLDADLNEDQDTDTTEHTVSLGYLVENYPITVRLDYGYYDEWGGRLKGHTVSGMVQVKW